MTDWMIVSCPHCGTKHNRHSPITERGAPPPAIHEGAVTLCFDCGEWSIFDDRLDLRKPTETESSEIKADPLANKVRKTWLKVQEKVRK